MQTLKHGDGSLGTGSLRSRSPASKPSASLKPKGVKVTEADIGRAVVYRTAPSYGPEQGIITSFNDKYVFVRYGLGSTSAATDPADLDWASGVNSKQVGSNPSSREAEG